MSRSKWRNKHVPGESPEAEPGSTERGRVVKRGSRGQRDAWCCQARLGAVSLSHGETAEGFREDLFK